MISGSSDLGDQPLSSLGKYTGRKRDSERRHNVPLWRKYRSGNTIRIGRALFFVDAIPLTHNIIQLIYKPGSLHDSIWSKRRQWVDIEVLFNKSRITIGQQYFSKCMRMGLTAITDI